MRLAPREPTAHAPRPHETPMADRSVRLGILAVLGIAAGFAALRIHGLEGRVLRVETAPRAEPSEVGRIAARLGDVEATIAATMKELETLRVEGKLALEVDRKLQELEGGFENASASLAEQRARLQAWDDRADEIGPRALDARMEAYRRGNEEQWHRLDEAARTAREVAESARASLGQMERDLARDEDRMWRELVAPSVQIMGHESVGSGVVLRSEARPGTDEFRTYVLTAWHVIRDLQTAPEDLDFSVQVTLFGVDRSVTPETATVLKYDSNVDVALLLLDTKREVDCGAKLAPRSRLARVRTFDRIYAVGCPLGNEPIPTFGEIADTHHVVDGSAYWMLSAPTYIGNSGGGIFDAQTHELLGIFSKIYTHGTLRPTVIPHMGLATSLATIYEWLDRVGYAQLEATDEVAATQAAAAKR